jgi:cytochrome b pre-mRNA-processing protein 3
MFLKRFFRPSTSPERSCYEAIVAAARHPVFYADWGVPDTLDGRFDMITLHTFLVLDRLKGEEQAFRQGLVDELFADMDRSLREMGVGDLSVGKKVRKMAEVFYGRVAAYDQALAGAPGALEAALARNIFPEQREGAGPGLLAAHVTGQRGHLAAQEAGAIAGGSVHFKEPGP